MRPKRNREAKKCDASKRFNPCTTTRRWSHHEKKCLLLALKRCHRDDVEGIAEFLPDRSLEEVKTYLDMQTKKAKVVDIPSFDVQRKTPIEIWLQKAEDLLGDGEDYSKAIGEVCSIIASCEQHDNRMSNRIPDYHALYVYIGNLLRGYKPPMLKSLDASVMVELIQDLAHQLTIRDTTLQRQLVEEKYRLLTECVERSNDQEAKFLIQRALQEDLLQDDGTSSHLSRLAGRPSTSQSTPSCSGVKIPKKGKGLPKKTSLFSLNPICIPVRYLRPNLKPNWQESSIPELRGLPPRKRAKRKKKTGTDDADSAGDVQRVVKTEVGTMDTDCQLTPEGQRQSAKKARSCGKKARSPTSTAVPGCLFSTRPLVPAAQGLLHSGQSDIFRQKAVSASQGTEPHLPTTQQSQPVQQTEATGLTGSESTSCLEDTEVTQGGAEGPYVTQVLIGAAMSITALANESGNQMSALTECVPMVTNHGSVLTESVPEVTEQGSVLTESMPVVTQQGSVLTESVPVVTQQGSVLTESLPVLTQQGEKEGAHYSQITNLKSLMINQVSTVRKSVIKPTVEASEISGPKTHEGSSLSQGTLVEKAGMVPRTPAEGEVVEPSCTVQTSSDGNSAEGNIHEVPVDEQLRATGVTRIFKIV